MSLINELAVGRSKKQTSEQYKAASVQRPEFRISGYQIEHTQNYEKYDEDGVSHSFCFTDTKGVVARKDVI